MTMRQPQPFDLEELKRRFDGGYYKRDAALSEQATGEQFPWQGRHCRDCEFWQASICLVDGKYRAAMSHTCRFYDPENHDEAEALIQKRTGTLDHT